MKLNKKLMCSVVALGLLCGPIDGVASSSASADAKAAYLRSLKEKLLRNGLNTSPEDLEVFYQVTSDKVAGLLKVWQEAKAADMSHAVIRAIIGTNRNQAAIDALTMGIEKLKKGSSSSSGATYATNAMIDEMLDKVYGKTPNFTDKGKVYAYLQMTMNSILSKKKAADPSANIDIKGELKELISEIKSYKDNDQYGLKAEQVIAFKIEGFDISQWKVLKKFGADFDTVLKLFKSGLRIDDIIERVKPKKASSSSSSSSGPTPEQLLADMIRDLGINLPGFSDRLTTENAARLLKALTSGIENNKGEVVFATAQERTDFLAQLKQDLQNYIKDGATGANLLVVFEKAVPYESWVAYKTNTNKSMADFVNAIAGGRVFFLTTDISMPQDIPTALAMLGWNAGAQSANLKKSYAKLSLQVHPDKHPAHSRLYTTYQNTLNAARELLIAKGLI